MIHRLLDRLPGLSVHLRMDPINSVIGNQHIAGQLGIEIDKGV